MRAREKRSFNGTVLVADDHGVFRLGLVSLLRRELGAGRIIEAPRFDDTLQLLKKTPIDLAIVDLSMPGLQDPRDLAQIRSQFPETRLVVLSASSSRKDMLESLAAGVHGYIVKNEPISELVTTLRYVLGGKVYVPPTLAELNEPPQDPSSEARQNPLTDRQVEVLRCLIEGKSNKEIARDLKIAQGTVKMHLAALFRTLGATNRAHAVALGKQLIG